MGLAENVDAEVCGTLSKEWNIRNGLVVPVSSDIALAGGGVRLDAAILYADLAGSTKLVMSLDKRVTARLFKSFLGASSRIIRHFGGEIRSFDGDRVMGIFLGDNKESVATKVALKINALVLDVLRPRFKAKYDVFANGTHTIAHCCGVDTSEVLVVRAGVRNDNDLTWIGRAPNVAAKLSNIRNASVQTFITSTVLARLDSPSRFSKGTDMWKAYTWNEVEGISSVYGSSYKWAL